MCWGRLYFLKILLQKSDNPNRSPRLDSLVASCNPLAVANFDLGAIIRAAIIDNTNRLLRVFSLKRD